MFRSHWNRGCHQAECAGFHVCICDTSAPIRIPGELSEKKIAVIRLITLFGINIAPELNGELLDHLQDRSTGWRPALILNSCHPHAAILPPSVVQYGTVARAGTLQSKKGDFLDHAGIFSEIPAYFPGERHTTENQAIPPDSSHPPHRSRKHIGAF